MDCSGADFILSSASTSRSETELSINIKKATSPEETAPKRKHVRSCIVYTWDHKSGQSFWAGLKVCVYKILLANTARRTAMEGAAALLQFPECAFEQGIMNLGGTSHESTYVFVLRSASAACSQRRLRECPEFTIATIKAGTEALPDHFEVANEQNWKYVSLTCFLQTTNPRR